MLKKNITEKNFLEQNKAWRKLLFFEDESMQYKYFFNALWNIKES